MTPEEQKLVDESFTHMDLESKNLVADRIEQLKTLFPEISVEGDGTIDFEKLRLILGDDVDEGQERYAFTWPGKADAIRQAQTPSTATLRPDEAASVNWDTTENLYIEGDNLEVLKLLQRGYHGKVKMIYIDPPYNTGKDFVYKDSFQDSVENYRKQAGLSDQSNAETSGRYHSDWLNMMYPRLRLARELLAEDGMIFISINDYEHTNLQKVVEEVFGSANFIEDYIWESTFRPDNSSPIYRKNAEYIVCYAKEKGKVKRLIGDMEKSGGLPSLTKSSMKLSTLSFEGGIVKTYLPDGEYKAGNRKSYTLENDVVVRNGLIINPFKLTGHVIWGQQYLEEQIAKGTEIIIKNDSFVPYTKKNDGTVHSPTKIIPKDRVGDVLRANSERDELFDSKVFDYPKPTTLIAYLLSYLSDKDYIVMDFFSGSATTAQSVMQMNADDSGERKFVLIQLPEECSKDSVPGQNGYETLCHVAEERIRRAGQKIKTAVEEENKQLKLGENPKVVPDIGFRVLKLDSSNFESVADGALIDDLIKPGRTSDDIIFEMMLKWGLELSLPMEKIEVAGYPITSVAADELICCMDKGLTVEALEAIAALGPKRVFFLDSILTDTIKLNAAQIFKRVGDKLGYEIELRTA